MKKIMLNDQFGLTQAVLEGRKTQTRRIVPSIPCYAVKENGKLKYLFAEDLQMRGNTLMLFINNEWHEAPKQSQPKYNIGEIVAVAQTYKDAGVPEDFVAEMLEPQAQFTKGWNNKMFVKAWLLPNRIRITDIKVERMQEISNEDCLKEGVIHYDDIIGEGYMLAEPYNNSYRRHCFTTPRKAFATLIDKVSGKGTWESNPWVFVYEFELVK